MTRLPPNHPDSAFNRKLREWGAHKEAERAAEEQRCTEQQRQIAEAEEEQRRAWQRMDEEGPEHLRGFTGIEDFEPDQNSLPIEERYRRYYASAIAGMLAEMAECQEGYRNHTLFVLAARLGNLSAGMNLPYQEMALELAKAAMKTGLSKHEVVKTIKSGLNTGLQKPWTPDD